MELSRRGSNRALLTWLGHLGPSLAASSGVSMAPKVLDPLGQPRQVGQTRVAPTAASRHEDDSTASWQSQLRIYIDDVQRIPSAFRFIPSALGVARTQTSLHVEKISRRTSAHPLVGTQRAQGLKRRVLLVDGLLLLDHTECVDRTRGVHSCTRSTHAARRERPNCQRGQGGA
jgi:hypothetical protein